MKIKLEAQYPLGPDIAVYKTDRPGVAHQLLRRVGLWENFKADSKGFSDVADQMPSFLALYQTTGLFALVHFRVLWNYENPGWALFIVYEEGKETLARQFANSVYDRIAAELVAEPDAHIHIQKYDQPGN
jgi:hypothetical protein